MSTPAAQAKVIAQVYPDIDGINLAENNQRSLFVCRGTIGKDEYYGIRANEMCFSMKSHMSSSSRYKSTTTIGQNGLVRTALNGIRFPEIIEQLIDKLRELNVSSELIRSVAMRQIKVIGLAFQHAYDHDSSPNGAKKDANFAVFVSGVILVPVRKKAMAIGDRVRWTVPLSEEYNRRGWFNPKVDQHMIGKIGLYAEPVDSATDFERTASAVAAFFAGNDELDEIAREAVDRAPHMLPMIAFPMNLKRLVMSSGIQMVYNLLASGMIQFTGPQVDENGRYVSSNVDGSVRDNGHAVFNFSDALRFTAGAGGATRSPEAGDNADRVGTFGNTRRGTSNLEAATEWAIAATQLGGLATSAAPPTSARGDRYANEGFYSSAQNQEQFIKGAAKFQALNDAVCQTLAANFYNGNMHYQSYTGFDPRTGRNSRVFIERETVRLDLQRDAGRAAKAQSEALPSALHSMHDMIEDMNPRGDGVVTRSGAVGGTAEVYFRPG
jgi:hypothetical protein